MCRVMAQERFDLKSRVRSQLGSIPIVFVISAGIDSYCGSVSLPHQLRLCAHANELDDELRDRNDATFLFLWSG